MPFVKVHIHCVWTTKNREPYLDSLELREKVWQHISDYAKSKAIYIEELNGHNNHCHCLISLGTDQTIQNVIKLLKGESSFWINKNKLTKTKFEWQDEYFALSISDSILPKVKQYIKNQEEHHRKKSFNEEYKEFIEKYNFLIK